ncbi:Tim44/TimA family putative adaptor protein [Aristophania vespae]|uniref:Tim44/TimA family putative adaptor protein n=1 Tax=Aristophania vespae TaxID=2697033 RepID=A0A6P1NEV0_9PROT|nr:Tim44/TimA family putative adaptor protein [Aristophania vespae]QHI95387.1 Tim44/TimA family putative adaptor protein [Aristophania vespae]
MTNFPWDIVLLAIIALLMGAILFYVLGRRIGAQSMKQESAPVVRHPSPQQENQKESRLRPPPLPQNNATEEEKTDYALPAENTPLAHELKTLQMGVSDFSAEGFLRQSEIFFREVLSALAKGDQSFLQSRLTPEAYDAFKAVLENRQKHGYQAHCEIKRIERLEYNSLAIIPSNHEGTESEDYLFQIRITSWQINYVADDKKTIIEGTEALTEFHDQWGLICSKHNGTLKLASATIF